MAKANLVLPDGTKVTIDGTADEVAALLDRFSSTGDDTTKRRSSRTGRRTGSTGRKTTTKKTTAKRTGPTDYIRDLIDEGYFKTKREIGTVRDKLEERARIYPVTSISGPLYRLVKKKELRRIREEGAWKYVNP